MANGINANLVRRWVKEAEVGTEIELGSVARQCEKAKPATPAAAKFLPVPLPAPVPTAADIRIGLQRGPTTVQALPYKVLFESQVVLPATGLVNLLITLHGVHHLP